MRRAFASSVLALFAGGSAQLPLVAIATIEKRMTGLALAISGRRKDANVAPLWTAAERLKELWRVRAARTRREHVALDSGAAMIVRRRTVQGVGYYTRRKEREHKRCNDK